MRLPVRYVTVNLASGPFEGGRRGGVCASAVKGRKPAGPAKVISCVSSASPWERRETKEPARSKNHIMQAYDRMEP